MASSADKVIAEIAERITERRNVYSAAMDADLALLCRKHSTGLVCSALERLKDPPKSATWDGGAHRREVANAIARLLERRRQDHPQNFADDGVKI
jgi:hypothetical protein